MAHNVLSSTHSFCYRSLDDSVWYHGAKHKNINKKYIRMELYLHFYNPLNDFSVLEEKLNYGNVNVAYR